jgi:hypothetical protein
LFGGVIYIEYLESMAMAYLFLHLEKLLGSDAKGAWSWTGIACMSMGITYALARINLEDLRGASFAEPGEHIISLYTLK